MAGGKSQGPAVCEAEIRIASALEGQEEPGEGSVDPAQALQVLVLKV